MGKKIVYTKITPLPSNVPRQLALDLLHSHEEMIKMNPLVTAVNTIEAPRNAGPDEYFSNWYEITEIITWGFGLKKKISFNGCFHDQPWGMQSHVFAPMNTDMRQTYRIGGNQPGEPREPRELGVETPLDGLYLREDVNITCNVPLTAGFVQKEMKQASGAMIDRLRRKAELLDEGKLHAMFENGKLKTAKPSGAATFEERPLPSPGSPSTGTGSPAPLWSPYSHPQGSPALDSKGFGRYHDVARQESVRSSSYLPHYQQQGYNGPQYAQTGAELPGQGQHNNFVSELPGSYYQPQNSNSLYPQPLKPQGQSFRSELMGDTEYQRPSSSQAGSSSFGSQPGSNSVGPTPPTQYQAYNRSPQPSPRLPPPTNGQHAPNGPSRNSSNSAYQVTNPDAPQEPQGLGLQQQRQSSSQGYNSMDEWRRSVQNDQPIDGSYYRNSRPPDTAVEPDHQRFSNLSIQQNASDSPAAAQTCKCPICGIFEGDEAAVSHHVSKAHITE